MKNSTRNMAMNVVEKLRDCIKGVKDSIEELRQDCKHDCGNGFDGCEHDDEKTILSMDLRDYEETLASVINMFPETYNNAFSTMTLAQLRDLHETSVTGSGLEIA